MDLLRSAIFWTAGISGMVVFFPFTFLIWLVCLPFDRKRRVIHRLLIWQSKYFVLVMPGRMLRIQGEERIKDNGTKVIISNHQSILDILIVNSLGYDYKWISKIENAKVPILGWYLKMASYITVDRGNRDSKDLMLARSLELLEAGESLMIFPEGTRSADKQIGFFRKGAFQLAITAGVPILPLILDGTGDILPKHGLIFKGSQDIKIKVLEQTAPEDFGTGNPEILAARFEGMYREKLEELRKERVRGGI